MSNVGYRIYQNFQRPDAELLSLFEGIPVPNLDDCMNRTASLGGGIHSLNGKRLTGPAYTISCPEGDNLLFLLCHCQCPARGCDRGGQQRFFRQGPLRGNHGKLGQSPSSWRVRHRWRHP